jgi:hypothetical protein
MIITKRRAVSVEDVTARLDALARTYHIQGNCYDESASETMPEFDALKWISLCSQRIALRQREYEAVPRSWEVPPRFLTIYETKPCSTSMSLENTSDSLSELAA